MAENHKVGVGGAVDVLDQESVEQIIDLRHAVAQHDTLIVIEDRPDPWWQRPFDITFAVLAGLLVAPVILGIALIILVTSGRPICYGQPRLGRNGQTFRCWKFRSMVKDAPLVLQRLLETDPAMRSEYAAGFKLRNDPRVTTIGKVIRRTSLDELPQFWNVLRGDLSLVGPRPIVRGELAKYGDCAGTLLSIRPGLTGLWQVSGRSTLSYDDRVALDMEYIERRSVWLNVRVLTRTVLQVLFPFGNGAC